MVSKVIVLERINGDHSKRKPGVWECKSLTMEGHDTSNCVYVEVSDEPVILKGGGEGSKSESHLGDFYKL